MRKTITIVAALLAAFFLTSCDQILEGFYPEFADGGTGQSGVVSVRVNVSTGSQGIMDFENGVAPIAIAFVPFTQTKDGFAPDPSGIQIQTVTKDQFEYLNSQYTYLATFEVTRNMITRVIVWCDKNNDNEPSNPDSISGTEPSLIVTTDNSMDYLDLRYHRPSDKEIVMSSAPLSNNSTISWNQFGSDPTAGTGGTDNGTNQKPNQPDIMTSMYYISSGSYAYVWSQNEYDPDPADWIVDHEWTINYDGSTEVVYTGSSAYFERQFYNSSSYSKNADITLRIQDNNGLWSDPSYLNPSITVNSGSNTINPMPTASFYASSYYPTTSDWVYFYDQSWDNGGYSSSYISSWYWIVYNQYGGAITSSYYSNFSWNFGTAGSYSVKLTVTDNDGGTNETTQYFTVSSTVVAGMSVSNPVPVDTTSFYASSGAGGNSDIYYRMSSSSINPYAAIYGSSPSSYLYVELYDANGLYLGSGNVYGNGASYVYAYIPNYTSSMIVRVYNYNYDPDYYYIYTY